MVANDSGQIGWEIMKPYKNKEWLKQKYIVEGKSTHEIENETDISHSTIHRWLKIHNIATRPEYELNRIEISRKLYESLEGLLLGDGSLERPNKKEGGVRLYCSDSHKSYMLWLKEYLSSLGLPTCEPHKNSGSWRIRSKCYGNLIDLYDDWYGKDGKKLPSDFKITPVKAFLWYIGDGNLGLNRVRFHITTLSDWIPELSDQMRDLGLKLSTPPDFIYIYSVDDFLKYCLKSNLEVPPSYKYKFKFPT